MYINIGSPLNPDAGNDQPPPFQTKICYQHGSTKVHCQNCHEFSNNSQSVINDILYQLKPNQDQSFHDKCTQCHKDLKQQSQSPHTTEIIGENRDCSYCHFEHIGKQNNQIFHQESDCTQCHKNQNTNYSEIHSNIEFIQHNNIKWKFNHTSHQSLHFTKSNHSFDCNTCHISSKNGQMKNVDFEQSCTSCHQHINQIKQNPLTLIQIPGLDYDVLIDENINIGEWPLDAGIDLETTLNESLLPLFSHDGRRSYQLLMEEEVDFIDLIDGADFEDELESYFWDLKKVLLTLTNPQVIESQFGITNNEDIQFIINTIIDWFPNLQDELESVSAGDLPETAVYEDYSTMDESINQLHKSAFDFNITYQSNRHKDPVLSHFYTTNQNQSMLLSEMPGNCLKCHSINNNKIDWDIPYSMEPERLLSKQFSHTSHAKNSTCNECHIYSDNGFKPMSLQSCESCHTKTEQMNTCTVCHSYHPIQTEIQ
ncbi:MAG: hypothetical protein ISR83_01820 [Candidatus Marinimicrobia bacterium]|nr:hypothetical protein [Candidatus Neomarinimicrobiota bacterium]